MSSGIRNTTVAALAVSLAVPATVGGARPEPDVGPGPVSVAMHGHGRVLWIGIPPDAAGRSNVVEVRIPRRGKPERSAAVSVRFEMLGMAMGAPRFRLRQTRPGLYRYTGPAI